MKFPIYCIVAKSQYYAAATFMRFQEHYESPSPYFRDRDFDRERYEDWYAEENGNFTYYSDWMGFNFPACVLEPFLSGKFDPLYRKEERLLNMFRHAIGDFYVIGTYQGSDFIYGLKHEFVHGLFYLDAAYREKVLQLLLLFNIERFKKYLRAEGYCDKVLEDETNAYLLTGLTESMRGHVETRRTRSLQLRLHKIFREHFGFSISRASSEAIVRMIHITNI